VAKLDFTKELADLYHPSTTTFEIVDVPHMPDLMVDGHGDPNITQEYTHAVEALYAVAYRAKFMSKAELARDYVIPPLEGLWTADNMRSFTTARDKGTWDWTMMIMVPAWITSEMYERACDDVRRKKHVTALQKLRMASYHEGRAVQITHIGSYDDEAPVLERLHQEWIPHHGYTENGNHHEIYLSDPRRTAAAKLKTVLRQPIRKT
jgi:hypothetical protein